jgi:hypothetical protein
MAVNGGDRGASRVGSHAELAAGSQHSKCKTRFRLSAQDTQKPVL